MTDFCTDCEQARRQFCPNNLLPNARVLIVGEAPGQQEVVFGTPFVGKSGELLRDVLFAIGIDPSTVAFANTVGCKPINVQTPSKKLYQHCRGKLLEELTFKPEIIVLLGSIALNAYTTEKSITKARGKFLKASLFGDIPVMPTWHPAAVLRTGSLYTDFMQDLDKVADFLKGAGVQVSHPVDASKHVVALTVVQAMAAMQHFNAKTFVLDVETTGLSEDKDHVIGISLADSEEHAIYISKRPLEDLTVQDRLREIIRNATCVIGHNVQFDKNFVYKDLGLDVEFAADTLLMSYALDERKGHGLKEIAQRRWGVPDWEAEIKPFLVKEGKKRVSYAEIPQEVLGKYANLDTAYTWRLFQELSAELRENPDQARLCKTLLFPGANALARVRRNGIKISQEQLHAEQTRQREIAENAKKFVQDYVNNPEYNPRSVPQTVHYLYEVLQAPTFKQALQFGMRSKGPQKEETTCAEHLERLSTGYAFSPFCAKLLEFRKASDMLSKWLKDFETDEPDGRIHAEFLLHSTVTGRLSTQSPNILNIPRDSTMRNMVIADDGNLLVSADYSQAELRTLAVLSGDEALIRVYEQGLDLHKEVAAYMYNVKPEDVTKEQRQTAKSVSFAIVYGGGAQVISGQLGVPISDGEKFVTAFYARFPTVKVWSENQFKTALDVGCIKSPSGRLRRFPFVPDSDIEEVRKQSINSPVQATASDAMLMSLILLDQRFRDRPDMYSDCRIIMPLHDSLLIEVPAHKAEQVCELVKRAMAYAPSKLLDVSRVPFLVDAKISKTWGE